MKIVTIDKGHQREGYCPFCQTRKTKFPVKLDDGSWTEGCSGCAERDGAAVMR